jgi:phospholipase/carboxylesterase
MMIPMPLSAAGPLDALVYDKKGAPLVVLFHGYGADAADLAPLATELGLAKPWAWAFPNGILKLDMGGRAWFPIDRETFEKIQFEGRPWDGGNRLPPDLDATRQAALECVAALGRPMSEVVLGGFSQGAMLATELALAGPEKPLGLAILSGGLFTESRWRELAPKKKGLRFFQTHGRQDPILDFAAAQRLEKLLKDGGLEGGLLPFDGGHGIPLEASEGLASFLDSLAGA